MTQRARLLAVFCATAFAWPALADPSRFAVVIGANRGAADEVQLHYAEQDAVRVGQVLVQLASVPEENLSLVQGAPAKHVLRVLQDVGARITRLRADHPEARPLLFVYFSGHSSAGGLHLGTSELAFVQLRSAVQTVGADLAIFVIDGCRSGGLTRSKGGTHAAPFTMTDEPAVQSKGTAVLASTAENEDAQESDRLGGGVFTTHFIAALRGAADTDGDKRVTLSEAYAYTYRQTLLTTSRMRAQQHPTYQFQLDGGQDLTLSRIDQGAGLGMLRFAEPGRYVLLDQGQSESVVAEFQLDRGADLLVPPGSYVIRQLGSRVVREGRIEVGEGATKDVSSTALSAIPYGSAVRRGLSQESAVSVNAELGGSAPVLTGFSPGIAAAVGASVDWTGARLQARVRFAQADAQNSDVRSSQLALGADLAAFHVFDWPRLHADLGVGVRVGLDRFWQSFVTNGFAPDRAAWVGRTSPVVRLEFAPHPRWLTGVECALDIHLMRVAHGNASQWETPVAPSCAVAASWYLP